MGDTILENFVTEMINIIFLIVGFVLLILFLPVLLLNKVEVKKFLKEIRDMNVDY